MGKYCELILDQSFAFEVEKHEALLKYLKTTFADDGKDFEDVKIALEAYFEHNAGNTVTLDPSGTLYVELDQNEEFEEDFQEEEDLIWKLKEFMADHSYIEYRNDDGHHERIYVYKGKIYCQEGEVVFPKMEGKE